MTVLPSDTIYKDLHRKGLGLTEGVKISVPQPQAKKSGLLRKLSSLMSRVQQSDILPMKILQVMNNMFIAIRTHTLFIYQYTYEEVSKKINVELISSTSLFYVVQEVYTCLERFVQDRDYPLLLKSKDGVGYFNLDLKSLVLTQRNFIKISNVAGVGWISDKECLIINDKSTYHYTIMNQALKQKSVHVRNLKKGNQEIIKRIWVIGNIDDQQDSTIVIFYGVLQKELKDDSKRWIMNLRIKQLTRTLDGEIMMLQNSDYEVQTKSLQYRQKFNILCVGDYYCLQLAKEVLILKKKFDKYMLLDNMVEIMNGFNIRLCKKGLIASIGEKLIELNCIRFANPKCVSKILDVIQLPHDLVAYNHNFHEIWPILIGKEFTLIFVFLKDHDIILSGLQKFQPMTKMLELAKVKGKQKLEIVQDMASNLGIQRKDFYLKLWVTSFKSNSQIYQYLIPCQNVQSIRKQLKNLLRTRKIQVSQMLKILQKITQINIMNLRSDLNQKNLKQYFKNDFLRRKIKLHDMDKLLDHKIFDMIYNSSVLTILCSIVSKEINPQKVLLDPLNSRKSQEVSKDLKSLENVLQEFKVLLLEDYEIFLRKFLSKFPDKILEIIQRFNFLLPNYPFQIDVQKPSRTNQPILNDPKTNGTPQQLWFQTVSVREWKEQLTKERILSEFFYDYPTSKITENVDQFYNSLYGKQNKIWKHGIITLGIQEYTKRIKCLNGIELYLNVCQFVNELSIERQAVQKVEKVEKVDKDKDDKKICQRLLEILERKNNLCGQDLHKCKLYSTMHYFMLKNRIFSKTKLDIMTLVNLQPQNLVAIFFLQNKQRKEYIFTQFKDLYVNKKQFYEVLSKFVSSQNCSRIELEILMNEMIDKGNQFQQQNQDLIQLLISGICMKVQIRENLLILDAEDEDDEGGSIIDDVQLSKPLALKINRVKQLKRARNIFRIFGLQKMTYQQLLDLEQKNKIFKLILERYFALFEVQSQDECSDKSGLVFEKSINLDVVIEGVGVNIQSRGGILKLLIYLQQAVYYSAQIKQIFLIFGQQLIWQRQFDQIQALINDDNILDTLKLNKENILNQLIQRALDQIYRDPQILYKEETKEQILNILDIDVEHDSRLKIREKARLQLGDILSSWQVDVHPIQIFTMCAVWKQQDRIGIMSDLIFGYIDRMSFDTLKQIYRLLEITHKQNRKVNLENKEFVMICNIYAKKLIENQRYLEVLEVIVFLMDTQDQPIDYSMLVESYIQTIIKQFDDVKVGKQYIEFFVQKYNTSEMYSIKQLLISNFDETVIGLWDRSPSIHINPRFLYEDTKIVRCQIQLSDLWRMSTKQGSTVADSYYNYFFLMMGLTNPQKGFSQTLGISYNLQKITQILIVDLKDLVQNKDDLWPINFMLFELMFLFEGMLRQAAYLLQINIDKDIKSKFDMILKQLRLRRADNEKIQKILNILTKLRAQVSNKVKNNERKDRFKKKLKEIIELEQQRNRTQEAPVEITQTSNSQPEIFLNWRRVVEDKRTISNMSCDPLSQKNLIDEVFKFDASRNMEYSPSQSNKAKIKKQNNYEYLFLPFKGAQKNQGNLIKLIKQERYSQVGNYPRQEVAMAIQKIFDQSPETDYKQVITVLELGNLGDPQKKELFKLAKLFPLSNNIRKKLFSLQFLMTPIAYGQGQDEEKFVILFEELKPVIQQIVKGISLSDLKQLANLISVILESSEYSARIYMEALFYIGSNLQFDSSSAFMAQECVVGMIDYPELISNEYKLILDTMSYDKQMRPYVRQILAKLMGERNYKQLAEEIKRY